MIDKLWYAIRDAIVASDTARFCNEASLIAIALGAYVALVTTSLTYVNAHLAAATFWAVLGLVAAAVGAIRRRKDHS